MATLNFQVLYPINDTKITLSDYDLNLKVKDLKFEISNRLNCSVDNIDLVLLGSVLDDDSIIRELELYSCSMIHIIIRDECKKLRTFEPFTEEQMQQTAKVFGKLQYSSFRKLIRPDAVKKILDEYPEFRSDKVAMTILKDSILLSSMQHIETLRKFNEKHRVLLAASDLILQTIYEFSAISRALPMITDDLSDSSSSSDNGGPANSSQISRITSEQLAIALSLANQARYSLQSSAQQNNLWEPPRNDAASSSSSGGTGPSTSASSAIAGRITSSMFSDALSAALNSAAPALPASTASNVPEAIVTPPTDMESNSARYATELQTMRDMGLIDDQVNLQALILCNGDVDAAINLLFSGAIA